MTDVLDRTDEELDEAPDDEGAEPSSIERLMQFAQADGDISEFLTEQELANLGSDVVRDWKRDDESRAEWKTKVTEALKTAAQEDGGTKTFPWDNSANVKYPILTISSQQFAARAMPAIVKGDEAVGVKVLGVAPVKPYLPPPQDGQPPSPELQQAAQQFQEATQRWTAKAERAKRVRTYLNYQIFYGMDDWEGDTDVLLHQLPVTGCAFRKVYFNAAEGRSCSELVNALNLTVNTETKSLKRAPRITQDFELYPYEIAQRQRAGVYRDIVLTPEGEDDQAPRKVLEQHRLHDLDGDGVEEPYIITVDEKTLQVLRIDAAFTDKDVDVNEDGKVLSIDRWVPFIKYEFLPDPKGRFYGIGFGHLLGPLTEVLNSTINQLLDAGTAQAAGGGFIASGLRLQGAGQTNVIRYQPGKYATVNMAGNDLKSAIWDRPNPAPSPVTFQMLDLIMGAAKDVASIKDVITGDAPANAPVGTTLALIEQGLQVFTAIYKRIYRAEKQEFQLLYECEGRYGNPQDYQDVLDDPQADMKADFAKDGKDIVPVSDPTVVTKMQALAKAQVIGQTSTLFVGAINPQVAAKRMLEAAEIDNPDELIATPQAPPGMAEKVDLDKASAEQKRASALKDTAEAGVITGEHHQQGVIDAASAQQGGIPGVEGAPGQPVGVPGGAEGVPGPDPGMDPSLMGPR